MNTELVRDGIDSSRDTSELFNQEYVDRVLNDYPKLFKEIFLKDGSNVAVLFNDALISEREKEVLPNYRYIVLAKYGLTQFNTSSNRYLSYDLLTEAIQKIVEVSNGEEVDNILISEWRKPIRNRINKGFIPLKAILVTTEVSGINIAKGIENFYDNVLSRIS